MWPAFSYLSAPGSEEFILFTLALLLFTLDLDLFKDLFKALFYFCKSYLPIFSVIISDSVLASSSYSYNSLPNFPLEGGM